MVLQDAAALMLEGRQHILFENHPAFHHPLFGQFKEDLSQALRNAPTHDPTKANLDQAIPGIGGQQFFNMHALINQSNHEQ